ncbi:DUF1189 family protein [Streptococcus hillyeri]|uniref:DUF1189 family protein n=1 Tax=Streptococcus hillyeri TaxID=2282420 RepID=UPI0034E20418
MPFPFSYFAQIMAPRRIFASRKSYKWWQIVISLVFLNSLILMPVSLHYASLKTYDMERIVSKGLNAVTDETYQALQVGQISENQFTGEPVSIEGTDAVVSVLPTKAEQQKIATSGKYGLVLTRDKWIFTYPNGHSLEALISGQQDLSTLKTKRDVRDFINQQWFVSHKADVFLFLILVYTAFLYVGSILLLVAGSATLYMTRKAGIFDLKTLKECFGLLLNCMGLPSFLAIIMACLGLVDNPILLMNVQIFGSILMMMLVLYRTGFKDYKK